MSAYVKQREKHWTDDHGQHKRGLYNPASYYLVGKEDFQLQVATCGIFHLHDGGP